MEEVEQEKTRRLSFAKDDNARESLRAEMDKMQ